MLGVWPWASTQAFERRLSTGTMADEPKLWRRPSESWEKQFSATTQYDSSQQLTAVQETLVTEMIKDLCDQIFNATVADW